MNANLFTHKIEMSKSEAKAAGKLNSDQYNELRQYMAAYPSFTIEIKAPAKRKTEFSGLNYDYMKKYIAAHDDDDHKQIEGRGQIQMFSDAVKMSVIGFDGRIADSFGGLGSYKAGENLLNSGA